MEKQSVTLMYLEKGVLSCTAFGFFTFDIQTTFKSGFQGDQVAGNPEDGRNGSARKRKSGVGTSEKEGARNNASASRWQKVIYREELVFISWFIYFVG